MASLNILLPKISPEGLVSDKDIEILKQATGLEADAKKKKVSKKTVKVSKKSLKGPRQGSISQQPHRKALAKQRSVLSEAKFGPGDGPNWAVGQTRYPNFACMLAQDSDPDIKTRMLKSRLALVRSKRAVRDTGTAPTQ